MRYKRYFGLAVLLVVLGIGGYYFYYKTYMLDTRQIFKEGQEFLFERDTDKALESYKKVLAEGAPKRVEARAKINIAGIYLVNRDLATQGEGVKLLKQVGFDNSYPDFERAWAIQLIADLYTLGRVGGILGKEYIFTEEPYVSFLDQSLRMPLRARIGVRKIYEYALTLYSSPVAEYRVAEWYIRRALFSKRARDASQPVKLPKPDSFYIYEAKQHLAKGNSALPEFLNLAVNLEIGHAYWLRGLVLSLLFEVEKDASYAGEAESMYKNALEFFGESRNSSRGKFMASWASFYYASFLYRTYGEARMADISKLLVSATDQQVRSGGLEKYLRAMIYDGELTYDYENVLSLAKLDKNFAEYLKSIGNSEKPIDGE